MNTVFYLDWPLQKRPALALYIRQLACRFFPAVYYMASSKVAIAVVGNLAFAFALCLYHLTTRVSALAV